MSDCCVGLRENRGRAARATLFAAAVVGKRCRRPAFAASSRHGNNLAGVHQALRIEGRTHLQHCRHVSFRKDQRQQFALVEADAMLAADAAARTNASFHQLASRFFDMLHFRG